MRGIAVTLIAVLCYTAIAGAVGAGGLGDIAIRYGYYRYEDGAMIATVVLLIVLVQLIQSGGLGDIAIRYGYYRYEDGAMIATVVLLIVLVQLIQSVCNLIARKVDHR